MQITAEIREKATRSLKWILLLLAGFFLGFIVIDGLFPVRINRDFSHVIYDSDGRVVHAFLSRDDKWRMQATLDEISVDLKTAFIAKEDRWFYWHPGVNPAAIARAAWSNLISGKRVSGASTITMQVARLLEPKERTILHKIQEMFRAFQLEWHYSKDEILAMYLNLAPYGGNIEGVKAASLLYFDRLPEQLSLAQVVALTIIPNRPTTLRIGNNNALIRQERDRWLTKLANDGAFPAERIKHARTEPFEYQRLQAPRNAPHLALRLRARYPDQFNIYSSLDRSMQTRTENLVFAANRRLRQQNIRQASVIVIDNATLQVKAYVGSPDFFNDDEAGQVDGVQAVRSPGSTLKPFIYALAIDNGLATPKTKIADVPVHIDGYSPENFDERYNGWVTIEDALAYSLNIPAVKTLQQIGVPTLIDKLIDAGFRQILLDRNKLGLSTALGGCGTRLEELATLYAALANQGQHATLAWTRDDTLITSKQVFSPGASFMVTESLTRLTRPDLPNNPGSSLRIPKIAWKTGTSHGRRDAWSIGYNRRFTIGVWAGNFNNEGVPELTGADIATPLLFDLFNTLDYNSPNQWYTPPDDVDFRFVCETSGFPPGELCDNTVLDYYIPGVSPAQSHDMKRLVSIAPDESISYCTSCRPQVGYKNKVYPDQPADLLAWYDRVGIRYDKIPRHNPECTRIFRDDPPRITSPIANQEYLLDTTDAPQIQLSAEAGNDVTLLYWYVDDRFVASAPKSEPVFIEIEPGIKKISCTDDRGRNIDITIRVSYF